MDLREIEANGENITKSHSSSSLKDVSDREATRKPRPSIASSNISFHQKLSLKTKIFFSVGHIYNDLTAAIWFSYTLLYFHFIFPDSLTGALFLIGQIADAVASPFIGYHSDKSPDIWLCRYGRRKTWNLLGVVMTTISVPLVYNKCPGCEHSSQYVLFFYYAVLITVFQAAMAFIQVSHVTLITDLTSDTNERIALNAYRQAATISSNIAFYLVTLAIIGFDDNGTITEKDLIVFTKVSYIVCAIGLVFSALFHFGVAEPEYTPKPRKVRPSVFTVERKRFIQSSRGSTTTMTLLATNTFDEPTPRTSVVSLPNPDNELGKYLKDKTGQKKWSHWLKSVNFWKITIMYTMARMFFNLGQVYMPLYLQYTLRMAKRTIAIVPFATYIAGLISSFAVKFISAKIGTRWVIVMGSIIGLLACGWIQFGENIAGYTTWQVYGVSAFLGTASTALLISSLSLTSDLIGSNTATGAFVFAAMSFVDKSVNGIAIAIFENFSPNIEEKKLSEDELYLMTSNFTVTKREEPREDYYKNILLAVSACSSIVIILGLLTILRSRYGLKAPSAGSVSSMH